jgi:putative nucleotidyltransferase with HDIG domain
MKPMSKHINQDFFDNLNEHLLQDAKPSDYINRLSKEPDFKEYPLSMLLLLQKTEQSIKYHPEGSVWNHTMLVVDEAAKVRDQSKQLRSFMWAALLHDIGKPDTTVNRKGKITSYDHDTVGARLTKDFLQCYTEDDNFIQEVSALVRYHMHMLYILKGLPFGNTKKMLQEVDAEEIALLCRCDRLGRSGVDADSVEAEYDEFKNRIMGSLQR